MVAQTNIQLYRQLIAAGCDDVSLGRVRSSYNLAQRLFSGCYRPNEKPFVAHLIGAASALAAWDEPLEMVLAGLLHSAYLYGDFGDGRSGATVFKRDVVRQTAGSEAERLVERYTHSGHGPVEGDREATVLWLADCVDELADGAARLAPQKGFGRKGDQQSVQRQIANLAAQHIGESAGRQFEQLFSEFAEFTPPPNVCSDRASFYRVGRGLPEARVPWRRRGKAISRALRGKQVA